ncbi:hypothetical protein Ciccas_009413 [Cichlidogyrus casuarinus]|uniref:alkaline phosphatase n=1 Tax=Cichlidogyrus casuarinus TaxID=1844966 RepID=A0ABD2PX46_9PLAT
MIAFDDAIHVARSLTSSQETLIIVTADHSHGLVISNGKRDDSIYGLFGFSPAQDKYSASMNVAYLTGPGSKVSIPKENEAKDMLHDINYTYPSLYHAKYASHGGEDVLIAADGPMARFVTGSHDNTYIAYMIEFLLGIGKISDSFDPSKQTHSILQNYYIHLQLLAVLVIAILFAVATCLYFKRCYKCQFCK